MTPLANNKDGEKHRTAHVHGRTAVPVIKGDQNLTDPQRSFLAAFREMAIIRRAGKVAEVGRQTHYDWMDASPEYRAAFEAAKEDADLGWRASVVGAG